MYKRKIGEYEIMIQQWQTKVSRLNQDNEELRRRLNDLGQANRKLA